MSSVIPDEFVHGLPDLLRFAVALSGDQPTAERLVAQAVDRVVADLGSLDDVRMARILARVWTVRGYLSQDMQLGAPSDPDVDRWVPAAGGEPDDLPARFARAPKLARAVVLLHYGAGVPPVDIALTVGSTADGISRYLDDIRQRLGVGRVSAARAAAMVGPVVARAVPPPGVDVDRVLDLLRGARPALFTDVDGAPHFPPPVDVPVTGPLQPPDRFLDRPLSGAAAFDVAGITDLLELSPEPEFDDTVDELIAIDTDVDVIEREAPSPAEGEVEAQAAAVTPVGLGDLVDVLGLSPEIVEREPAAGVSVDAAAEGDPGDDLNVAEAEAPAVPVDADIVDDSAALLDLSPELLDEASPDVASDAASREAIDSAAAVAEAGGADESVVAAALLLEPPTGSAGTSPAAPDFAAGAGADPLDLSPDLSPDLSLDLSLADVEADVGTDDETHDEGDVPSGDGIEDADVEAPVVADAVADPVADDTALMPEVLGGELVEPLADDVDQDSDYGLDDEFDDDFEQGPDADRADDDGLDTPLGEDQESDDGPPPVETLSEETPEAAAEWHTVPPSRPEAPPRSEPVGLPVRRGPRHTTLDAGRRAVAAGPTSGLVDEEREPNRWLTRRRIAALALAVVAVVLIAVGVALVSTSGGGTEPSASPPTVPTRPIARSLPGTVGLGTWNGTGSTVVHAGTHQLASGRDLAVSLECTGDGPVSVGPVTQSDCASGAGAVTGSVAAAGATALHVVAPAGTAWRFSLLDEPLSGTNGALVSLPNAVLDAPSDNRVGSGQGSGDASVELTSTTGGLALQNVRIVLTCQGHGVTLSSDDGSVVDQYTRSCFSGWSYEFDVPQVRLPTTLHVTAAAGTSWNLVAVPF